MMKSLLTGALLASLFGGGAWAQDTAPRDQDQAADAVSDDGSTAAPIVRTQSQDELRMQWISGATVTSPRGETIGVVEDVIIDQDTDRLSAAVIAFGGFLGFGTKQIAVAWKDVQIDYDAQEITLDITPEQAESAPAYVFRDRARAPADMPVDGGGMGDPTTAGGTADER